MGNNGKNELTPGPGGLFGEIRESDFPSELIKANANFETALANCCLRDEEQRNACVVYKAQLEMFGMVEEINDLVNFLNGSVSIGGYSRVLAASSHIGMLHPSALGVKLNKEGQEAWAMAAMQHQLKREKREQEEHEG